MNILCFSLNPKQAGFKPAPTPCTLLSAPATAESAEITPGTGFIVHRLSKDLPYSQGGIQESPPPFPVSFNPTYATGTMIPVILSFGLKFLCTTQLQTL